MTMPPADPTIPGAAGTPYAVLPVALAISGRVVVVVGAGRIATRKVESLLGTGAQIRVVAPEASDEMRSLVQTETLISWRAHSFSSSDLEGADLVFTATDDPAVDHDVAVAARAVGLWVNAADQPDDCTFYMTANVRRGPVVVAVSTSGVSPALASYLRQRLEHHLEAELGELAERIGEARAHILSAGARSESLPWATVVNDELVALASAHDWSAVDARLSLLLEGVP
jgi:precorrin-2 dehydrogenase / sirohydrochlorin ferrochelatase